METRKQMEKVEPRENTDGFGIEFYNVDERVIVVPGLINFAIGGSTLTERRRNLCIKRNRISILTVGPRHWLRAEPPSRSIYEQSVKNINRFAVTESPVNGNGFFLRVMGRGDKRQRTFITVQPWCWTVGTIENKTIRVTIKLSKKENYR